MAVPPVEVVPDLVYRAESELHPSPVRLDVYAPTGVEGGPVVVLLHGLGDAKEEYQDLATAIAEQGAVVFVPNWQTGGFPYDPSAARGAFLAIVDGASCAVSFALAHAAEYGADPEALVLVGQSAGAHMAAMVALREANPLPDCAVEMTPFVANGMVLWEGDWLLSIDPGLWDNYGDGLPMVMEAVTPWAWLATAPRMSVSLVTTLASRSGMKRCEVSDPDNPFWLRDPTGWFRERLEAAGALEDGCIDIVENNELLAATMREEGFDVAELLLEHSNHSTLGHEDQQLVAAEILAIGDR